MIHGLLQVQVESPGSRTNESLHVVPTGRRVDFPPLIASLITSGQGEIRIKNWSQPVLQVLPCEFSGESLLLGLCLRGPATTTIPTLAC